MNLRKSLVILLSIIVLSFYDFNINDVEDPDVKEI